MAIETLSFFFFSCFMILGTALLLPRTLTSNIIKAICGTNKGSGATFVYSLLSFLVLLLAISLYDVRKTDTVKENSERALRQLDVASAKLNILAALSSIVLMFVIRAFALEISNHQKLQRNHDVLIRQVRGMQSHLDTLNHLNTNSNLDKAYEDFENKISRLETLNTDLKIKCEESVKQANKATLDAKAILDQVNGYEREFDRLNEENRRLERELNQYRITPSSSSSAHQNSRKDL